MKLKALYLNGNIIIGFAAGVGTHSSFAAVECPL